MPAKELTYVVRIWWESNFSDSEVWRASATETISRERRFFSSPRALAQFLGIEAESDSEVGPPPSALTDYPP